MPELETGSGKEKKGEHEGTTAAAAIDALNAVQKANESATPSSGRGAPKVNIPTHASMQRRQRELVNNIAALTKLSAGSAKTAHEQRKHKANSEEQVSTPLAANNSEMCLDESSFMTRLEQISSPAEMEKFFNNRIEKARRQVEEKRRGGAQTNAANQEPTEGEPLAQSKEHEAFKAQVDRDVRASQQAMAKTAQLLSEQRAAQLEVIVLRRKSDELPEGTPAKQTTQSQLAASQQTAKKLTEQALEAASELLRSEGFSVSPGALGEDWGSPIVHTSPVKQLLDDVQTDVINAQRATIEDQLEAADDTQRQQLELSRSLLDELDKSINGEQLDESDYNPIALADSLGLPVTAEQAEVLGEGGVRSHTPPPDDLAEEGVAGHHVSMTTPLRKPEFDAALRMSKDVSETAQKAAQIRLPDSDDKKNEERQNEEEQDTSLRLSMDLVRAGPQNDGFTEVVLHDVTDEEQQRLTKKTAVMGKVSAVANEQEKAPLMPQTVVRKAPLTPGRKAGMGLAIGGGFGFAFSAAASVYFVSQASGLVGIPAIASVAVAGVSLLLLIAGVALLCKHQPGRVATQSVLKREQQAVNHSQTHSPGENV